MSARKRVLVITQEMKPYLDLTDISTIVSSLPQKLQQQKLELRVLMPRFGSINERRHRLHEVVRLSGINIVVNDEDYPLIIKVASLPGARLQVYFLDSDDYFDRRHMYHDEDGKEFEDNAERMMFFALSALETTKKFGWAPDVIHCHGWMSGLVPMLLKTQYKNEAVFENAKVIYSAYQEETLDNAIVPDFQKFVVENTEVSEEDVAIFKEGREVDLNVGGLHYADAITIGSEDIEEEIQAEFDSRDVLKLDYDDEADMLVQYAEFVKSVIAQKEESSEEE